MQEILADTVHRNASGDIVITFTSWQGARRWTYPVQDFRWVRRWTRIGPDGGNTDTILGVVDFARLVAFLAEQPIAQQFGYRDLVAAGVAE